MGKWAVIKPAEIIVGVTLYELAKGLKQKGISLEELIERGRETREELIDKEYRITDPSSP